MTLIVGITLREIFLINTMHLLGQVPASRRTSTPTRPQRGPSDYNHDEDLQGFVNSGKGLLSLLILG